jgi:hypothetical protein
MRTAGNELGLASLPIAARVEMVMPPYRSIGNAIESLPPSPMLLPAGTVEAAWE